MVKKYWEFWVTLIIGAIVFAAAFFSGAKPGVLFSIIGIFVSLVLGKLLDLIREKRINDELSFSALLLLKQEVALYKARMKFIIDLHLKNMAVPGYDSGKEYYQNLFLEKMLSETQSFNFPMFNSTLQNGSFYKISDKKIKAAFVDIKENLQIFPRKIEQVIARGSDDSFNILFEQLKFSINFIEEKISLKELKLDYA